MNRYVCIHGHFYQPPRENPWLEEVELQDSAYPYHDWNERITSECYAPNAVSRMLDGDGKIINIVNNYSSISFNFGPSLLWWLEAKEPEVYDRILEADKLSQERFSGHGSALAQVYNHMIMPLANDRDKYTQALWGIRDFEYRFQRKPEGIWLSETAVDLKTLDVLAELEIKFVILSPYQAGRTRKLGSEHWQDATGGKIDPTTAYTQHLPSGKSITLFFYDGPVSRAVAFEKLLEKGEYLSNRLQGVFSPERTLPQLVHIATDGESYGHHHIHGDMGLAYALQQIEQKPGVQLTIYGEFLEKHPPVHEVEIVENTSWSCMHGIERWRSDCGCNSGRSDVNQKWRAPLREALDWLRDAVAGRFEEKCKEHLSDPWAARNNYISVILERSPESISEFVVDHADRELNEEEKVLVLQLMELQRNAMLMYTSCGWFFDDISGIETVQCIAYAGRVIQLAEELFEQDLEGPFLGKLEKAQSNFPKQGNGRRIYERWIKPCCVGWNQITAHYAVSSLFEDYADTTTIFCYTVERQNFHNLTAGKAKLVIGRARVSSEITRVSQNRCFAAVLFGDHNVTGAVCAFQGDQHYQDHVKELGEAFERADFPQVLRLLDRGFGESTYSLKSLFRDEQRKVVDQLLQLQRDDIEGVYRKLIEDNLTTIRFLADMGVPLQSSLRPAMEFVVRTDLRAAFASDNPDLEQVQELLDEAQRWDVPLDSKGLAFQLNATLGRMANRFHDHPTELESLLDLKHLVELASALPFEVELWEPQNVYFRMLQTVFPELEARSNGDATSHEWLSHFLELGEKLGVQVADLKKKMTELKKSPPLDKVLDEIFTKSHIPSATYRWQLRQDFGFAEAQNLVSYLSELGISDCYASPILQAAPGSPHGYDISDHGCINKELGGKEGFDNLAATLDRHGIGMILDTVPNHMDIAHAGNQWWQDVLENGPSSTHAGYFDVDWHPTNPNLENKVLLPVLGDQYGAVLENGQIQLHYEDGSFFLTYFEHRFPIAPGTYGMILEHGLEELIERLGEEHEQVLELQSILTALRNLPERTETGPEKVAERSREKEIIKRRLATLADENAFIVKHIESALNTFNGTAGEAESFEKLNELLDAQAYRPAFWRVATDEINYRRFFDVNSLAAIRVEVSDVFESTHELILDLIGQGKVTGLRIDHPDGLWNPANYFRQLQDAVTVAQAKRRLGTGELPQETREELDHRFTESVNGREAPNWPLYVVAEKILGPSEPLPSDWAVHGTTGYDSLNVINGLFVDSKYEQSLTEIYAGFIGNIIDFEAIVQSNKRLIMLVSLASEINSLSHRLDLISERNRRYRDFTLNSLTFVIREIIASLVVYRTYITGPDAISPRDNQYIESAVARAKRRNPRTAEAIFDFVRDILLLRNLNDFRREDQLEIIDWVMSFQQITGPVMAKSVEDTAFYIFHRLVSLNEVGGHPDHFGVSMEDFHQSNCQRREHWPHSMIASSTHDTKRSEDVRARLNAISELPEEWEVAVQRWRQMNLSKKTKLDNLLAPTPNDEYLLYQTLVGAWPAEPMPPDCMACFRDRIISYMQKAIREAKVHTSWVNPNSEYDLAMEEFVERVLPDNLDDVFLLDMLQFQKRISFFGFLNSLAQTLLKLTIPGVPDIYQGTELWDYSLVDPDNRRPVDFALRRSIIDDFRTRLNDLGEDYLPLAGELMNNLIDGRAKLYIIYRTLQYRRSHQSLFRDGEYEPLQATGAKHGHLCGFARSSKDQTIVVAVPRLIAGLTGGKEELPLGDKHWQQTRLQLPAGTSQRRLRNLFTNECIAVADNDTSPAVSAADLFADFPVFLGEVT